MTKIENSGSDTSTSRSHQRKDKHRGRQKKEKTKPPTKVIIRHLPPTMTEEEFLKQIELPDYDFFYYATADWSLGNCATCRAYVTLKRYDDVFLFRDRFDGYVFVDSKGAEYSAIVEFAPFQGLVKNRSRRSDNKANTIEEEAHYQQFLAKLEEEREAVAKGSDIKLEFSLDRKKEEITSTPLLQYLANKKEKRREEAKKRSEEKRRQREEEKERRRQTQQPQVTKIMSGQSNAKSSGANTGGDTKGKDGNAAGGERKNSRAKRKAEREQRRKEQREKAQTNTEEKVPHNETAAAAVDDKSGRESKKYSEKRERERERNRNRKDKDKPKSETSTASAASATTAVTTTNASAAAADGVTVKVLKSKDEQISDTVLNFIRSVANVKEFVPKHKQQSAEPEKSNDGKTVDKDVKKTPSSDSKLSAKLSVEKEKSKEDQESKEYVSNATDSAVSFNKKEEAERQRREERRIRNKDRPSIAIYQPKPRQRTSEESDTNTGLSKDVLSDCESVKKDDLKGGKKKVSRYSERRSERRAVAATNKSKSNEMPDDVPKILRKSLSSDELSKPDAVIEQKSSKESVEVVKESTDTVEKQDV